MVRKTHHDPEDIRLSSLAVSSERICSVEAFIEGSCFQFNSIKKLAFQPVKNKLKNKIF